MQSDWSDTRGEIWRGEETYWELVRDADVEGFLDLLHRRFIGWPGGAETPVAFADFRPSVTDWFEAVSAAEFDYSLTPRAIVVAGDVAVSHYQVRISYEYDDAETRESRESRESRITHTWQREDGEWRIIGGMGCRRPET